LRAAQWCCEPSSGIDDWEVERSLAWLLAKCRLNVRYERRADVLTAFLSLVCALICARQPRLL
jgi:hypothetical protein